RGFAKETIKFSGIRTIDNDDYARTSELYSLNVARDCLQSNTVISYGDIIFKDHVLHELINSEGEISIVVDPEPEAKEGYTDYVETSLRYSRSTFGQSVTLKRMSSELPQGSRHGEFIGLWKVTGHGAELVREALDRKSREDNFR